MAQRSIRRMFARADKPARFGTGCEMKSKAAQMLAERGIIKSGDSLLVTRGDEAGVQGGTNTMKIISV